VLGIHISLGILTWTSRYVFRNIHSETGWEVRTTALNAARELAGEIERRLPIPTDSVAPVSLSEKLIITYTQLLSSLGPNLS
jgi:hypothetical protein